MKKALRLFAVLVTFVALAGVEGGSVNASKGNLATITGTVTDNRGNPVAGALVSLFREGARQVVKQIKTGANGSFSAKIAPGRYGLRAVADGFYEVAFSSVQVRASQELIYRFNLEPVGTGKTLPETRKDRDDTKWTLRSAHTRRSIFQVQDGEDADIPTVTGSNGDSDQVASETAEPSSSAKGRTQGVVETYFASSALGAPYAGVNFAIATPVSEKVELIFAGQTGASQLAPERIELTTLVRAGQRHRLDISAGGARRETAFASANGSRPARSLGQFSVRAIDEWVVRDGIVIVLGLDYSRFVGASSAHAITPRIGLQFDANARTRIRAAYAPGGGEGRTMSFADFEGRQVAFSGTNSPVALIDGKSVMERSHRLEFGLERVLDNYSSVEAGAFFDSTSGRGVGLLATSLSAFSGPAGENLLTVANQQGNARGMRVVYTRRLSRVWTASGGYSLGRGQRLSPQAISDPAHVFDNGFFQTVALQLAGGFSSGTNVRTVLRFSPRATVFAIDPFAGRLGVYDPSLSIQVTQELPSFGLPLRAEAILDARNLLDAQANTDNGEILNQLTTSRRSVRGGISLRF